MREKLPDIIFYHVPNEGKKSPFEAYKHSLMGNVKGLPDFIFMQPKIEEEKRYGLPSIFNLKYLGLCIELKAPEHTRVVQKGPKTGKTVKAKGILSPEQKELLAKLNKMRYRAVCCYGADEAIKEIITYFSK